MKSQSLDIIALFYGVSMILLLLRFGAGEIRPGKPGENGGGCSGHKVASFFLVDDSPSSNGASTSTKRLSDSDPGSLTSLDLADRFCSTMGMTQATSSIAFTTIAMMKAINIMRPLPLLFPRKSPEPHILENTTSNTKEVAPTETNVLMFVRAVSSEESSFPSVLQRMMHAQIPMTVLYDGNCGHVGSCETSIKSDRQRRR